MRFNDLVVSALVVFSSCYIERLVDKVFAMGRFYDNGRIYETGLLKGRKALLSITTGGPEKNYVTAKYSSTSEILHPIQVGIFEFVGFSVLPPEINFSIEHITDEE